MAEQVQVRSGPDAAEETRRKVDKIVAGAEFVYLKGGFGGGVEVHPLKKRRR